MDKCPDAFRTISEAADDLKLPQHVLRFWETRFQQIKPLKRGGGRRYYRPEDVALLRAIRDLLYGEGYTIKGVQRILKEKGVKGLIELRRGLAEAAESGPEAAPARELRGARRPETAGPAPQGPGAYAAGAIETALRDIGECQRILTAADAA